MKIPPCAYASLDMALWDLMAKKANKPLYKYLGLPKPSQPTSVTIGINPVDIIRERIPLILKDNKFKSLKVKLGNPLVFGACGFESGLSEFGATLGGAGRRSSRARVSILSSLGTSVERARGVGLITARLRLPVVKRNGRGPATPSVHQPSLPLSSLSIYI